MPIDPWSDNACHADAAAVTPCKDEPHDSPKTDPATGSLTPVVGSPALAGLGVALIVPGTLLDVVA